MDRGTRCAGAIILASLLWALSSSAAEINVTPNAPFGVANDGVCSLQEAVDNANDDAATRPDCTAGNGADVITLPAGVYGGAGRLGPELTIQGAGREATTVDWLDQDTLGNGPIELQDLRISNRVDLYGGDVSMRRVVFSQAALYHVADWPGHIDLTDVDFESGHISVGGYYAGHGPLSMILSRVRGPEIEFFAAGHLTIDQSGIGFLSVSGGFDVEDCPSCCSPVGPGPEVVIQRSTVGGISRPIPSCQYWSCTCGGNAADVKLVGSTVTGGLGTYVKLSVGSVVSDLRALPFPIPVCGAQIGTSRYSIDTDGSCGLSDPTDLPNTDPMLGPLQDSGGPTLTHALLPGSPAVDAIPVAACTWDHDADPATPEVPIGADQRGVPRPQNGSCDIGAYEVTACADGTDNDGDALADYPADPGCRDAASVREDPQCQDGLNNDSGQDGLIDFDGGLSVLGYVASDPDPQCVGKPWRNQERTGCGMGAELALVLPLLMWLRRRAARAMGRTGVSGVRGVWGDSGTKGRETARGWGARAPLSTRRPAASGRGDASHRPQDAGLRGPRRGDT
jgi:hypothetical protein